MTKAAAIQMCSSNILQDNLETAARLIEEASYNGAKLVVLPEMFPIIGTNPYDKVSLKENYGNGVIQSFLANKSKEFNVYIVGGTIPISCNNKNKIRAACLVYNNMGVEVARYDKMHLFDALILDSEIYKESSTTEPGNGVVVVDTPIGKLGLSVCYDIRFPSLFQSLRNLGAEIISIPSAFTLRTGKSHWKLLSKARAVENFCYLIGACQGGVHHSGRETYGHSLMINPWGDVLEESVKSGNDIIYADIDLEFLYKTRKAFFQET